MKAIIEMFVTVVFLSLMVVIASQVIGSQLVINSAHTFHTNAVQKIEESDFDSGVIATCIQEAADKGYVLTVTYDRTNVIECTNCNSQWNIGEGVTCSNCGSSNVVTNYENTSGEVKLTYDVEIALLGISESGTLQSNAR